jgi:hypothetical protein
LIEGSQGSYYKKNNNEDDFVDVKVDERC